MPDNWGEWSKHVLLELERLDKRIEDLRGDMAKIALDVQSLKVKAAVFGALAGFVPMIFDLFVRLRG